MPHVLRQVPIFQPVDMLCARQSQTDFRWESTRVVRHAVGTSCCARTSGVARAKHERRGGDSVASGGSQRWGEGGKVTEADVAISRQGIYLSQVGNPRRGGCHRSPGDAAET